MGVEKGVAKGRNPEKHLLDIAEITKVPKSIWEGGHPQIGQCTKERVSFSGIPSLILHEQCSCIMSTVSHCLSSSPQNLA